MSRVALTAGYLCILAVLINICARVGWIHLRLPFLTGFAARWGWTLGAVVCFIIVWYVERSNRSHPN